MTVRADAAPKARKRLRARGARFWIPATIVLVLLALLVLVAAAAIALLPRVLTAKDALEAAVPLAAKAKNEILAGKPEAAKQTVARFDELVQEAQEAADSDLWRFAERVPGVGENLRAVSMVAASVGRLGTEVFAPATEIDFQALKPVDGKVDVHKLADLLPLVERATETGDSVIAELSKLDGDQLVGPLRDGVEQLEAAVHELSAMSGPASTVLKILPDALGANGPRNYLLMFPNNAEIRAGGGNPAALALVSAKDGVLKIRKQASSRDFGVEDLPLNPETEALYGARVKRQMQDVTYTPYFAETAELMRGFWASKFDTRIDAVVSFDPVALSYLLEATGPITLETGEKLTAKNAVSLLLKDAYVKYPTPAESDAFFASAAQSIFDAVTHEAHDVKALIEALARAADEERLMYSSNDPAQMKLIGSGRIAGPLPADNAESTVLGVFFNYVLAAKMDYYMDSSIEAKTTQCTATVSDPATFRATVKLENVLTAKELERLPKFVTGTDFGQGGGIYRDVLFYGPLGTKVKSVKVNGTMLDPLGRWGNNYRKMEHDGRPVVQVPLLVGMGKSAQVKVVFVATKDQPVDSFGPFAVHAAPTVRTTPVEVSSPGCRP